MVGESGKESLVAELAAARDQLVVHTIAVRRAINISERLKRSIRRNPMAWFGGAAILGLLLSKVPPSRRKVVVKTTGRRGHVEKAGKAAFALALLKFTLDLVKPAMLTWFKNRLAKTSRDKAPTPKLRDPRAA